LEFSIRTGKEAANAEARSHEAALVKYLTARRRALLRVENPDKPFSELPKRAMVSGGGVSKSYRVKWEKVGRRKSRFPGARFVFSVEESGLRRLLGMFKAGA
jgi:hypothetical protein